MASSRSPSLPSSAGLNWPDFQRQLQEAGHRRMVLLEGDRAASLRWLDEALSSLDLTAGLWVGREQDTPHQGFEGIRHTQARQWLGRELDCVVWDGWQGTAPEGLAALSGTLCAGGLFFWLMPPLQAWPTFDDPDYQRLGLTQSGAGSDHPFAARLAERLGANGDVIRISPENPESLRTLIPPERPDGPPFAVGETEAQSRLVDQVVRVGLGRRRRPLVITADRGRGKSAALGIAAARLLQQGRQKILVTAPEQASVDTLFRHAQAESGETALGERLTFLPVEQLLVEAPNAELVIVDEAAGIPPHRLKQILLSWPRVVFATTVHGYEGAGRGFSIRFRAVLDRETPQWKAVALAAPIRWSESDPLEPLTSDLFLLNADAPELDEALKIEPVIQCWDPAKASEDELRAAFGLMVEAHYRTSPADLRQWMDDPAAVTWTLTLNGKLAGVLWATTEGGLDSELANEVMLGRRRVRGHLLAQSLATHSGFSEAAEQRLLRVVRIAVADNARGRGFGKHLVKAATDYARQQGLNAIGTSFGSDSGLLDFWQASGLEFVRLGLTREASTGEMPLQMLAGTTDSGSRLVADLRQRLSEHWLTLVPLNWSTLDPELLLSLTARLPAGAELNDRDRQDLASFANGHRGFDLTLPVLRKLSLCPDFVDWLERNGASITQLWSRAVLQGWAWPDLQAAKLCVGREQGERQLRVAVGKHWENQPDL